MAEADLKKRQMEYIGIAALGVVAFFIGITRFRKSDVENEVFSRKRFNEKWKEVEMLEAKVPQVEKAIAYPAGLERIPFKNPFEGKKEIQIKEEDINLPAMTFQGMVWNSHRPQAIINNKVYEVNDTIEIELGDVKAKVQVKDITRKGISLRYKGRDFIVKPK